MTKNKRDIAVIDLKILARNSREDYENKRWEPYMQYLSKFNEILKSLHEMDLVTDIALIEEVPEGQRGAYGIIGSQPEQAKLREIANDSERILARLESDSQSTKQRSNLSRVNSRKVFVVHGRNIQIRDSMFNFLRAIKLDPIEWSEAINATGKGTPHIGEILDKAFEDAQAVVVLLTPDDEAQLREIFWAEQEEEFEKRLAFQARPNVLFEAGMAFGRNPDRTIIVEMGQLRPFSDIAGRNVIRFDGSPKRRMELAQRLKTAGCEVSTEGHDFLDVGDFTIL